MYKLKLISELLLPHSEIFICTVETPKIKYTMKPNYKTLVQQHILNSFSRNFI